MAAAREPSRAASSVATATGVLPVLAVLLAAADTPERRSGQASSGTSWVGVVEARVLIGRLQLALDHFIGMLVVEGDYKVLVELLRCEDTQTRIPQVLQDEFLALLGGFSACEVQHIYREGNHVADALCHVAYQRPGLWKGGVMLPLCVLEKARDDAHGAAHERIHKAKV